MENPPEGINTIYQQALRTAMPAVITTGRLDIVDGATSQACAGFAWTRTGAEAPY